jgi:hypothetical protein
MKINISPAVLNTDGNGLWSQLAGPVHVTGAELGYINEEADFAELRVSFDSSKWDILQNGLIYTDEQFLEELRNLLRKNGFSTDAVADIDYSEQGMQGHDYVSLDVGEYFIAEVIGAIAPQYV